MATSKSRRPREQDGGKRQDLTLIHGQKADPDSWSALDSNSRTHTASTNRPGRIRADRLRRARRCQSPNSPDPNLPQTHQSLAPERADQSDHPALRETASPAFSIDRVSVPSRRTCLFDSLYCYCAVSARSFHTGWQAGMTNQSLVQSFPKGIGADFLLFPLPAAESHTRAE